VSMEKQERTRKIRNLVFFVAFSLGVPWLGWALDLGRGADPHNQQDSLGWLFFLVSPLLAVILLRVFAGDGWKDAGLRPHFKGNGGWYVFALLFHPLSMGLILLVGSLLGVTKLAELSAGQLSLLAGAILSLSLSSFFKNIFEEFAWRGYLAPKLANLVSRPLLGHFLVGLVWFGWHLPYYIVLMAPEVLSKATALALAPFLFITFLGIFPTAILYDELRFRTDSVWPAVLIHTCANMFFDALIVQKVFSLPGVFAEALISPAMFSLASILLTILAILWLDRKKMKKESSHA